MYIVYKAMGTEEITKQAYIQERRGPKTKPCGIPTFRCWEDEEEDAKETEEEGPVQQENWGGGLEAELETFQSISQELCSITNHQRNANQNYNVVSSHQWPSSKNLQTINAGEGVEKREPSGTVGGNVN